MKKSTFGLALSLACMNTISANIFTQENIKKQLTVRNLPIAVVLGFATYFAYKSLQPISTKDLIKETNKKIDFIKLRITDLANKKTFTKDEIKNAIKKNNILNLQVITKQLKDAVKLIKINNASLRKRLPSMNENEMQDVLKNIEESHDLVKNVETLLKEFKTNSQFYQEAINANMIEKKYKAVLSSNSQNDFTSGIKEIVYDLFSDSADSMLKLEKEISKDISKLNCNPELKASLIKIKEELTKTYAYKKQEENKVLNDIKQDELKKLGHA